MKLLVAAAAVAAGLVAAPVLKVDAGEWTYGLAANGGSVWAGGLAIGDVLRIDPSSGKVVSRVNIGSRVFNLASAPGAVWAVANITGTATRIDAHSGKVTATVRVGNGPYDIEWGFGSAWVSNSEDGTVSRITGKKVIKTIKVGVEPNGLSAIGRLLWVTGLRGSLYVSQETNVVTRVDARTMKVLGSGKVKRNPLGTAIVAGKLWVPCIDAGVIVVVDPTTMRIEKELQGGPGPIVVLPSGGHVWVSHTTGTAVWRM